MKLSDGTALRQLNDQRGSLQMTGCPFLFCSGCGAAYVGTGLQVKVQILGRLLEAWRLSRREAPHGCTTAFAMLHRKMGDLRDEVVHSCGFQLFFGVAVHHRELRHDKSAFAMRWIEGDLIVACLCHFVASYGGC